LLDELKLRYDTLPQTAICTHRVDLGLEQTLHLANTTAYKNGMVELRYKIIK